MPPDMPSDEISADEGTDEVVSGSWEKTDQSVKADALSIAIDIAVKYGLEDLVDIVNRDVERLIEILMAGLKPFEPYVRSVNDGLITAINDLTRPDWKQAPRAD